MKVIASHNGMKAATHAFELLRSGASPLDACVEGVTLVEDDPLELTVGFGGLPNEDGVVELDAAVMDGRTHRGGAVAALQGIRHPTKVARLVMQRTKRVLLVGQGALRFALANGFEQENLLTEKAREMWLYWKRRRGQHDDWIPPDDDEADLDVPLWFRKRLDNSADSASTKLDDPSPETAGTVHVAAIDDKGDMACATSTSGHAFKIAGRVGDSPILGAGLYVDNQFGTCGSIGHGEANLQNLSSFAAVEWLRGGSSPCHTGEEVLRRIVSKTQPEQLDDQQRPQFNLQLFILSREGLHAGVSMWSGKQLAVSDKDGTRLEACRWLYHK